MTLALMFTTMSLTYGLPPNLLSSICYIESKHEVTAIHLNDGKSHSYGVCQIKMKTARWLGFKGTEDELMKPEVNVKYAAKYLHYQLKRHHGDIIASIISYNRGNAKNLTHTKYSDKVVKVWRSEAWAMR